MPQHLSRRHALKAAGLGAAALASLRVRGALAQSAAGDPGSGSYNYKDNTISFNEMYGNPPFLGRVHGSAWIRIFTEPTPRSNTVRTVYWGYVMPILASVHGVPYDTRAQSDVWFQINEGYVHSAYVVPGHEQFQQPEEEVPADGFWGEVVVPHSWQYTRPTLHSYQWDWAHYMGFWGQVHRVINRDVDEEGRVWYQLYDDVEPKRQAWVFAKHIRRVAVDEFDPISPDVTDKLIRIELNAQVVTCYEGDQIVFQTRTATGSSFQDDEGNLHDLSTAKGDYTVTRKRPSRRMRGGDEFGLPYDVNGVPWVTYFGGTGAAIHGAYWHNNYGRPRSHGCINVTPDAAKWVYRWTQPYLGYDEEYRFTEVGEAATEIIVTG